MKYIVFFVFTFFLIGCLGLTDDQQATAVTVASSALVGLGPIGYLASLLLPPAFLIWRGYKKDQAIEDSVYELSLDNYDEFDNLTDRQKRQLDARVRVRLPKQYHKLYDKCKKFPP